MSTESSAQDRPLVSVICRSIGRPELAKALDSIAAQTWSHLEVVLIDAAGGGLKDFIAAHPELAVNLISTDRTYTRSEAANAGLAAARGFYLLFLDDDDWLAPSHIAGLVDCLRSQPECKAAYSSTQKTDRLGTPLDTVFAEDFDPELLMRDNYIPIHAMLFERSLLEHGCRFDESFEIYEDWDFWLQLSQHTAFRHLDQISAFYREGGDSATAANDVGERYLESTLLGKARAAIFDKWRQRWTGQQLNQLIGRMDQSTALVELAEQLHLTRTNLEESRTSQDELRARLEESRASLEESRASEDELRASLEESRASLEESRTSLDELRARLDESLAVRGALQDELHRANEQLADKDAEISRLNDHVVNVEKQVADLSAEIRRMQNSLTWKLTGPLRRVYRYIRPVTAARTQQNPK